MGRRPACAFPQRPCCGGITGSSIPSWGCGSLSTSCSVARFDVSHWLGDDSKLEQVPVNLLSNAIQASPPGSVVRVSCRKEVEDLFFSVTDQGAGMDAAERDRLFAAFETPQSRKSDGTRSIRLGPLIAQKDRVGAWRAYGGGERAGCRPDLRLHRVLCPCRSVTSVTIATRGRVTRDVCVSKSPGGTRCYPRRNFAHRVHLGVEAQGLSENPLHDGRRSRIGD